jgi:hypothetical protein
MPCESPLYDLHIAIGYAHGRDNWSKLAGLHHRRYSWAFATAVTRFLVADGEKERIAHEVPFQSFEMWN